MSNVGFTEDDIEQACMALSIAASNDEGDSLRELVDSGKVRRLVWDAFMAVPTPLTDGDKLAEQYAEAESWIRCGWRRLGDERLFRGHL